MNVTQVAVIVLIAGRVGQRVVVSAGFGGFSERAGHVIGVVEGASACGVGNFLLSHVAGVQRIIRSVTFDAVAPVTATPRTSTG